MSNRSDGTAREGVLDGTHGDLTPPDAEQLHDRFEEDLWLDRVARRVGMGWLSRRLPGDVPPSYLYALVLVGTIAPTLNLYAYFSGESVVYLQNPLFVLQPISLLAAVYGARSLRRRYHRVIQEMNIEERASRPERLRNIVPTWLPWVFFAGALVQNFARIFALGGFSAIYQNRGLSSLLGWTIVNPIWATIAVQFLAVYLSIELIAPWRLWKSDVGIDFLDPEGLGGLRPIGELIKHAYYYMVVGLIFFALVVYGPVVSVSSWGPTATTSAVFTGLWLATIATVAFAVFILHRFMRQEKRLELQRLNAMLRDLMENPWDIKTYSVGDDRREVVDELRRRMDHVSATSEYPATFSIWSQLIISAVLPKAFQLLLSFG